MSGVSNSDDQAVEAAEAYRRRKATSVLAIVFTDIADSTRLREQLGELEYERRREPFDAQFESIVTREDSGSVVKGTGDGALAVFSEPSTAVERCLEIQRTLGQHDAFKLRIGIDMGQVSVKSSFGIVADVFGRHVNRAARIESLAAPGHVLVSFHVYDCAVGWLRGERIRWHNHGEVVLKGFEEEVSVHEIYDPLMTSPQAADQFPRGVRDRPMFPVWLTLTLPIIGALTPNLLRLRETSSIGARSPLEHYSEAIAHTVARLQPFVSDPLSVLWVNDFPENNTQVQDLLRKSGCRLTLATSTAQGEQLLGSERYFLIITDMGRGVDAAAGLELLRFRRATGMATPIFIYSSVSAVALYGEKARAEGCALCTAGLVSLLDGVLQVLHSLKSRLT